MFVAWDARTTKFLIQKIGRHLFFKRPDHWVRDVAEATDFKNSLTAMAAVRHYGLKDVCILMHFGNPRWDIRLPAAVWPDVQER